MVVHFVLIIIISTTEYFIPTYRQSIVKIDKVKYKIYTFTHIINAIHTNNNNKNNNNNIS